MEHNFGNNFFFFITFVAELLGRHVIHSLKFFTAVLPLADKSLMSIDS
jgi:hypothetical protein